jgi:hypothetical protein
MATITWQPHRTDEASYRALLGLHLVRRRLEVAQLRADMKRDAALARVALEDQLGIEAVRYRHPEIGSGSADLSAWTE